MQSLKLFEHRMLMGYHTVLKKKSCDLQHLYYDFNILLLFSDFFNGCKI